MDFREISHRELLLKSVEKIQFSCNSDKGALREDIGTFMVLPRRILVEWIWNERGK